MTYDDEVNTLMVLTQVAHCNMAAILVDPLGLHVLSVAVAQTGVIGQRQQAGSL